MNFWDVYYFKHLSVEKYTIYLLFVKDKIPLFFIRLRKKKGFSFLTKNKGANLQDLPPIFLHFRKCTN